MKIRREIVLQTCLGPHQFIMLTTMRIITAVKQQLRLRRLHHQGYRVTQHHCKLYMLKSLTTINTFILTKVDDFFQMYINLVSYTHTY